MKICTFGEIIWDVYPDKAVIGGAPLNFCAHAVKCGAEGAMISAVGQDELGNRALEALETLGVRCDFVSRNLLPTGQCLVTLDKSGVPSYRVLTNVAYDAVSVDGAMTEKLKTEKFDAFVFGTLAQRDPRSRASLLGILQTVPFPEIFCDINLRDGCYDADSVQNCLRYATTLKLSDEEEPRLGVYDFWRALGEGDLPAKLMRLFDLYPNLARILLTLGKDGAVLLRRGKETVSFPAAPCEVVSTVGAGDSFGAAFLSCFLRGDGEENACRTASRVAAFVVSHREAIPDYRLEELGER